MSEIKEMRVFACVLTRNRFALLKECIDGLRRQTRRPDSILVVDNESSDESAEWLNAQRDIIYISNSNNLGCSGGFYRAAKEAYIRNATHIWLMDDDVEPYEDCLEELLKVEEGSVAQPCRKDLAGNSIFLDPTILNLRNPFKLFHLELVKEQQNNVDFIPLAAFPFEGPLIPRKVFEVVGFPNREMIICADDTEFSLRVHFAGFKMYIVTRAKMTRKLQDYGSRKPFTWKDFYMLRNLVFLDKKYMGAFKASIRASRYAMSYLKRCATFRQCLYVVKAAKDGLLGNLGNSVRPGAPL